MAIGRYTVAALTLVSVGATVLCVVAAPASPDELLEAAACAEEQVEEAEELLAESMSTNLLQVTLKQRRTPLQFDAAISAVGTEAESTHSNLVEESKAELGEPTAVNCTEHLPFCNPVVNCAADPITDVNRSVWNHRLATADGHINLRTWCMVYPQYATSLQKCVIDRDPAGYAEETLVTQTSSNLVWADGVYCYASGHCNHTAPALNTTNAEVEQLCDARYGRSVWTSVGYSDITSAFGTAHDLTEKYFRNETTWAELKRVGKYEAEISAQVACAMGNFHCDAIYCHKYYCGKEQFDQFREFSW